jgi:hypothetical protein
MTNKGKLIFLIVFVLTSLLLQYNFTVSEIKLNDIIRTTIGGVVAVLLISIYRVEIKKNDCY